MHTYWQSSIYFGSGEVPGAGLGPSIDGTLSGVPDPGWLDQRGVG